MKQNLSLKQQIVRCIGYEWVNGGWVEQFALGRGYKASNGSRRARELAELGVLERKEEKGSVWYRKNQKPKNTTEMTARIEMINSMQPKVEVFKTTKGTQLKLL